MRKRILAMLLCICMVVVMVPTVAYAAGGKAIQLVESLGNSTGGISGYNSSDTSYNYVYYGAFDLTDDKKDNPTPIKWRVLDDRTNKGEAGLFLLSEGLLVDNMFFDDERYSNAWQGSDVQGWCKDFTGESGPSGEVPNAFTGAELASILATTKDDDEFEISGKNSCSFDASKNILNGDKVFFLSAEEAENSKYGFTDNDSRIAYYGENDKDWWLRSPSTYGINNNTAGVVSCYGGVYYEVVGDPNDQNGLRPAFNLDMSSVLFTSDATGGKSAKGMDTGLTAVPTTTPSEWKLTLADSSRSEFTATTTGKTDNKLTLSYSGAKTGTNEYISAMVKDSSGGITYYGRLKNTTAETDASGTADIDLSGVTMNTGDTLHIFNEEYNGDKKTDYASALQKIDVTVVDNTAPTLTAGAVNRTADANATVKFTSSEGGHYYYEIVEKGETAPTIDTTAVGTSCDTTEQTITLSSLTAGAKDIYIVVKDGAGNVSDVLKITIPVPDITAPTLTGGEVKRIGDIVATVKFTSDEEGQYYYKIVESGEADSTIDTTAEGASCDTTEQTISLTLTAGAKDIYIVVKDGAGNVSPVLKITIPTAGGAIQLGTGGIIDPAEKTDEKGTYHTPNSYIYYGKDKGTTPIKWRVLDADKNNTDTDGMFLLSEYLLTGGVYFDNTREPKSNVWKGSDAQGWCKDFAGESGSSVTDALSAYELAAILTTSKSDASIKQLYDVSWGESALNSDKVFFLSAEELAKYVGNYEKAPGLETRDTAGEENDWWLRSPSAVETDTAGSVGDGLISQEDVNAGIAARPAFNLNQNSVLLSSAAGGGKSEEGMDTGLTAVSTTTPSEWKLTLLGADRSFTAATMAVDSNKLTLSYSGAKTGTNEYISAIVKDNSGIITHYGRILQLDGTTNGARGTVEVALPADMTEKTLYIFNEQYNGGANDDTKLTDYGSNLVAVSLTKNYNSVTNTLTNITSNGLPFAIDNADYTATLTALSGYQLPASITVTVGGTTFTAGKTTYEYNSANGELTIYAATITGNIEITATGVAAHALTVNLNGGNGSTTSGTYAANALVTINAGTKANYTFAGWTTSNGGTFDDATSAGTTFTMPGNDTTITAAWTYNGGGGGYVPTVQKPTIEADTGVIVTLSPDGTTAEIKATEGYSLKEVILNGKSLGQITEVKGLKTGDKLVVKAEKKAEPPKEPTKAEIIALVKKAQTRTKSKTVIVNGKKAVRLTWTVTGYEGDLDGFQVFRSTKKYSGYGVKPIYSTKNKKYLNTKSLKAGTTYYYKVRGYNLVGGEKVYTPWSLKAWRTIK